MPLHRGSGSILGEKDLDYMHNFIYSMHLGEVLIPQVV